jgi:hypothetical protein
MSTYVIKSVVPGQHIAFSVSGEGTAPREAQDANANTASGPPGGGLGVPVGGENPMGPSGMWYVLGGLVVAVSAGAYFVARRPVPNEGKAVVGAAARSEHSPAIPDNLPTGHTAKQVQSTSAAIRLPSLMDLLKDELFQIETEHLEGKIPKQQYDEIRAGINALMRRHISKHPPNRTG